MSHPTPTFNAPNHMSMSRPPSLLNGLMWGMGMGVGSEVGHSAVRAVTGGNKESNVEQEEVKGKSTYQQEAEYHPCASLTISFLNVIAE